MALRKSVLIMGSAVALAAATATAAPAIVGGNAAQGAPGWNGSLEVSGKGHVCGAALVSPTWAVTAAHCIATLKNGTRADQARFGSMNRNSGGQLARISKTVASPDGTDIALVRLDSPVSADPTPIAASSPPDGAEATLFGFGQITPEPGGPVSPVLKQLQTTLIADSVCAKEGEYNGKTDLCLKATTTATACFGDSGGPALVNGALVGVTSRGGSEGCGTTPEVYTDVTVFSSWIRQTTQNDTSPTPGPSDDPQSPPASGPQSPPASGRAAGGPIAGGRVEAPGAP